MAKRKKFQPEKLSNEERADMRESALLVLKSLDEMGMAAPAARATRIAAGGCSCVCTCDAQDPPSTRGFFGLGLGYSKLSPIPK